MTRWWWRCLFLHDYQRRVRGTRVFLECATCGAETPGWDLDAPAPVMRFEGPLTDREVRHARKHKIVPVVQPESTVMRLVKRG